MFPKWLKQVLKFLAPKLDAKIEQGKRDILEHLFRKSKRMKVLLDYVHKPNSADKRIEYQEAEIKALKKENLEIKKFVKKELASLKKLIKVLKLK
tara:strand:+ start:205 stop:489 length:285 start_codon:yes stop_codon:yes gene_type:complete